MFITYLQCAYSLIHLKMSLEVCISCCYGHVRADVII